MKFIVLSVLLLTVGCGKGYEDIVYHDVQDPTLGVYVDEFVEIAQQCFDKQPVYTKLAYGFNELEEIRKDPERKNTVATCYSSPSGHAMIAVMHSYFYYIPKELKKLVVFHEMIHCYLGQFGHVKETGHIMSSYFSISAPDFRDNFKTHMEKAFNKKTHCDLQYEDRELPEGAEMNPLTINLKIIRR